MATDPNEVGGMGGWVIDPANPNRATYTDEYGDVYEAFKDEAIALVEGVTGEPAPQEMVRPSVVMGTAPTDTAPRVLPTPKVATTIKFGDEINALDNNVWKNKAAEAASVFDQLMADPTRTEDEIRKYVADSGYTVQNLDENLADRAAGKRTKNAVVDSKFNDPLGQLDQPIEKIEPGDRGGWDRFSDYFTSESQRGFQGILRRTWDDWANTGKDQLREQFPGMDEEWYEAMSELTSRVGQKAIIQEVEARNKMDPLWQPDETLVEAALSINRWAPALIGSMAGSAGPETFFAPGKTAVSRILNQGLISGGSRLGYNSVDYLQGISEDLDLQSVFADVLIGGATQGVFEVPGAVKELYKARGRDTTPGADPREPAPTFGEDTAKIVEEAAVKQIIDGIDPKLKPKLSARYIERATDKVNEITADWQNAPSIKIARDEAEIEEALGYTIDPDAVGVVLPDGTVAINMKNVDSEETLTAAVFHEGLGHHGLTQQFGEALDATLDDLYAGSTWFQRQVDDWMQRNPDAYADDLNPRARAAEEVLAEMSEAGRMPPPLLQKIERMVREFARQFMNVDINEREIKVILDMAHNATVNGKRNDVVGNGFKYMYVGTNARSMGWDKSYDDALAREKLTAEGLDPDSVNVKIFRDTGMFRGPDRGLRKEISDDKAAMYPSFDNLKEGQTTRLQNILNHPTLYKEYPFLRDVKFQKKPWPGEPGIHGWAEGTDLVVVTPSATNPVSVILHEVQHIIQEYEGWAVGGTTKAGMSRLSKKQVSALKADKIKEVNENLAIMDKEVEAFSTLLKSRERAEIISDYLLNEDWDEYSSRVYELLEDQFFNGKSYNRLTRTERDRYDEMVAVFHDDEALDEALIRLKTQAESYVGFGEEIRAAKNGTELYDLMKNDPRAFDIYEGIFGEIEARDTQARQNLTEQERRETLPYSSANEIPDERITVDDRSTAGRYSQEPRYMRKRTQGKGSEGQLQGGSRRDFDNVETERNLGLGRFRSNQNIEGILEEQSPDYTKESWNDWIDEANDIRNKAKVAKNLKTGSSAPEILAAREAIVKSANRIAQLSRKAADMTLSPKEEYYLFAEMARNADMQDALAGVRSNAARIVNSFRISVETDESFTDAIRNMMKNVNNTVLSDPANRAQLLKQLADNVDNPDAINRLSKAVFTPKAEEYIFRVWYNMLLSSPGTHEVNFLGTGANFMYDLLENTGAAILGQGKRFSNADRVRGREVAYRMWGALRALTTASTWKNAAKSFDTGLTGNIPNAKTDNSNVYTGTNKGIKAASYVLEGPTRALAGADEWWRNVLQLSNIYGLAVRNAGNKGLKGKAFWKEVDNLINAPTKEMIDATLDYTKVLQFLDKPSALAQTIINAQTPKVNDGAVNRVGRGILKVAVPFVRTPDALIRTAIRRSGFLSPLERENIAGWKAGGADKDKVKARMIMGGALAFFVASQVYNGTITGAGPSDFRKKMEWLGSHQENSIKVGDEWYSIQGLEPVSTNISAIATLVERYKSGELTDEEYAKSALTATHGLATVLVDNSYLENMTNLVDIFGGDPDQAQNALNNFLVGIGASITTPAILRSYTQSQDPAIRDTTGDGSFTDRLQGRIDSGVPGLSDKLPQKYDVYGRPMTKETYDVAGRLRSKDEETDPVIIELSRLSDTTDKVIVGAPKKSGISFNGSEPRRLTAEEFQAYQQLSGYWIVESVRQEMATPEWEEMTDEERIELVNDIKKDMRANAREELFGGEVDDEEEG